MCYNDMLFTVQESSCPVCLGFDLCEDITSGFLSLVSEMAVKDTATQALVYRGNIGVQHPVHIQVFTLENLYLSSIKAEQLIIFICQVRH